MYNFQNIGTCSASNAQTSCCKVKSFPDCHFRNVLVILANISCCLMRNKLIQLVSIVRDLSTDLVFKIFQASQQEQLNFVCVI